MKKKAEDLKPGDVVVTSSSRIIVVEVEGDVTFGVRVGFAGEGVRAFGFQREVDVVESPTLSPAQQHAEELVKLVRDTLEEPKWEMDGHAAMTLLARIDPPKPPSVEEALELIAYGIGPGSGDYKPGEFTKRAVEMLERARAAGLLGKDAH